MENTDSSTEKLVFGIGLVRKEKKKKSLKNSMTVAYVGFVGLLQVSCANVMCSRLGFLVTSLLCPLLLSCHEVHRS